jgi:hypothetical protein
MKESCDRFVVIRHAIYEKCETLLEANIYAYIEGWQTSLSQSCVELYAGIALMSQLFKVSEPTIKRALARMTDTGLIAKKRTQRGMIYTTNVDVAARWEKTRQIKNENQTDQNDLSDRSKRSDRQIKMIPQTDQNDPSSYKTNNKTLHKNNYNLPLPPQGGRGGVGVGDSSSSEIQSQPSASQSDFNSGTGLPRTHAFTEPVTKPMSLRYSESQRNLISQVLGASGGETKLGQFLKQEMADKPGFLEYCLNETLKKMKSGKMTGLPFAYLRQVVGNQWNNGEWISPAVVQSNADLEEVLAAMERPINRLDLTDEEHTEKLNAIRAEVASNPSLTKALMLRFANAYTMKILDRRELAI